jgi:bacterial polymer biosynthesis proteins, WecB/TagA/CpsF family
MDASLNDRKAIPSVNVLGVDVSRVDYESAVEVIMQAARDGRSFGAGALAVHGVMEANRDREFCGMLRRMDLLTPDGQPVRWAMNLLGAAELKERVYGPTLMLKVCERAAAEGLSIFLYGSTPTVLDRLSHNLKQKFPGLSIAGMTPGRFRESSPKEDEDDIRQIAESGAGIVMVGLGCPRQEKWVANHLGLIHAPMLAVGAAFDFHAGLKAQAPRILQDHGLEWLFRLIQEPRRLWRRYLIFNPLFVLGLSRQLIRSRVA